MTYLVYPGGQVSQLQVAALDVDAQKGFTPICPNELPVPDGHLIVDELNRQAEFALYRIASKDTHPIGAKWEASKEFPQLSPVVGESNIDIRWNQHCVSGTKGNELLDGLPAMEGYDFWAIKGTEGNAHPYGACYQDLAKKISTGLIEWLSFYNIDTVIVGGLATDFCVKETVKELLDLEGGLTVILNLAATRGIDPELVAQALDELGKRDNFVLINSSEELSLMY